MQSGTFQEITDTAPVIFDTIITSAAPNITYDATTGIFTIATPGLYYINWWVAADAAPVVNTINLTIATSAGQNIQASSNIAALNFSGNALLDVTTAPLTFSLVNQSGGSVFIGEFPAQADLTVVQLI